MRQICFMAVAGILSSMSLNAFADCSLASCDNFKDPGSCDRVLAVYNLCFDRDAQARWSAGKAGMQNSDESKAVKNFDNVQKAVTSGMNDRVTASPAR